MRDRLIELLLKSDPLHERDMDDDLVDGEIEAIADHLLAEGVIVPPCKVGQKVYVDEDSFSPFAVYYKHTFIRSKCFAIGEIVSITKTKKQLLMKIRISNEIHTRYFQKRYTVNAIGKTVFLTREEAEKALAEREGKG